MTERAGPSIEIEPHTSRALGEAALTGLGQNEKRFADKFAWRPLHKAEIRIAILDDQEDGPTYYPWALWLHLDKLSGLSSSAVLKAWEAAQSYHDESDEALAKLNKAYDKNGKTHTTPELLRETEDALKTIAELELAEESFNGTTAWKPRKTKGQPSKKHQERVAKRVEQVKQRPDTAIVSAWYKARYMHTKRRRFWKKQIDACEDHPAQILAVKIDKAETLTQLNDLKMEFSQRFLH